MRLKELLRTVEYTSSTPDLDDIEIEAIACDSKAARKGCLFVAIAGTKLDGHTFVSEAVKKGALCVVIQKDIALDDSVAKIYVNDSRSALAKIASEFYGRPSEKIKCIGITGTNGKTTISYLMDSILSTAGHKIGVIGTINYRLGNKSIPATNTTPGPIELQSFLNEMVRNSIDYAVMEVSSHSLDQKRVEAIKYSVAVFTNLTGEHLDYHKTQGNYFNAKAQLFEGLCDDSYAVINLDDEWGKKLLNRSRGKILTYAVKSDSQVRALGVRMSLNGTEFTIDTPKGRTDIRTKLIGTHNVYNIAASVAAGICLGLPLDLIKVGVENLMTVPGRLEAIDCGQPFWVFVDYAHTDDALYNVLRALRPLIQKRIIVLFGCGGERDRTKRPRMGKVASKYADFVVVTSDNPRGEDPKTIAKEIEAGIETKDYSVILDREEAIKEALSKAGQGDCVILAGKGHEAYQIFKDKTVPFDDREVVRKILCLTQKKF